MAILIKNGRVWDGQQFLFADILTEGNIISRIEPNISAEKAYVFDAAGMTVTPGLVDLHVHMRGISTDIYGIHTEMSCFPFGVTAAVDAGAEYGDRQLLDSFRVKNAVFVCSRIREDRADLSVSSAHLEKYGDRAVGIKVYHSGKQVQSLRPLEQICAFARERGLPVMVHCNGSPVPMAELLEVLAPGDILTHIYHGGTNTAAEDDFEALKAAQKRGVILDAGFAGHVHTDFSIFRAAVASGFVPNTISTDITCASAFMRGGRYGMTMCMSMARTAGLPEEAIFRCTTSAPARALGQNWGQLQAGGTADIAVLSYTDEPFYLTDKAGNTLESPRGYRCKLTVSDGIVVFRD